MRLFAPSSGKNLERPYDTGTSQWSSTSTAHIGIAGVRGGTGLSENCLQNELHVFSESPERGTLKIEFKFPGTSRGELGWDASDFTFTDFGEMSGWFVRSSTFPAGRHGAKVDEDGFIARRV